MQSTFKIKSVQTGKYLVSLNTPTKSRDQWSENGSTDIHRIDASYQTDTNKIELLWEFIRSNSDDDTYIIKNVSNGMFLNGEEAGKRSKSMGGLDVLLRITDANVRAAELLPAFKWRLIESDCSSIKIAHVSGFILDQGSFLNKKPWLVKEKEMLTKYKFIRTEGNMTTAEMVNKMFGVILEK